MHRTAVSLLLLAAISLGCNSPSEEPTTEASTGTGTTADLTTVTTVDPTTTTATTTTGDPITSSSSSTTDTTTDGAGCVPLQCDGAQYACGDCMDNDGDGKYDGADPECVSPCDDKEDTFATGLPGDNMDPCKQDCFFDGNSGGGPGDCAWNLKCDPLSPGGDVCPYDDGFSNCPEMQSDECVMNCQVPNGCDCFGCCSVVVEGMQYDIFLGDADCSLDNIANCESCTPNDDCLDECHPELCEVCFGEELPPECEEANCEDGTPCEVDDMGGSNCPPEMYCATGCCELIVPG
jgi:hypothetical protein